ncbi:hypothetical protein Tco_0791427 [Tanacetum coccineum]
MDRSYARRASAIQVTTGTRIDWLLTFFLGLQVTRTDDGIFISQDKYVDEEVWFFNCEDSKPDIMFVVCAYARVQVTPKLSHLHVVKRIFRYLKGQPKLGLWSRLISWQCKKKTMVANSTTEAEYVAASNYCGQIKHIEIRHHFIRDSNEKKLIQMSKIHTDQNVADLLTKAFDDVEWNATTAEDRIEVKTGNSKVNAVGPYLVLLGKTVFNDEYDTPSHTKKVFANIRRQGKDISGIVTPLFATMLTQSQAVEGEDSGQPTEPQHIPTTTSPSHNVHKERGDNMERAVTTAISLDAEQGSGNIIRTQSMAIFNEPIPQGTGSGSGPKHQDTILGDRPAQTSSCLGKYKDCSGFGNYKSKEESQEVGKEEKVKNSTTQEEGRNETDQDEGISWFQKDAKTQGRYGHDTEINTVSTSITTASINITTTEPVITASAPAVFVSTAEPSTPPTTTTTFIEDEKLQAELDEEVRLEIEREEEASNATLIKEWDSIEARIDADAQLA